MPFRTGYVNHDIEAGFPTSPMPQSLPEILCTPEDDAILRQQIQQIDGDKVQRVAILSFRGLQLYRIAKLQAELVKKQNAMMNPGTEVPEKEPDASDQREKDRQVDELLQRYGEFNGVQYMVQYSNLGIETPERACLLLTVYSGCCSKLRDIIANNRIQRESLVRVPRWKTGI